MFDIKYIWAVYKKYVILFLLFLILFIVFMSINYINTHKSYNVKNIGDKNINVKINKKDGDFNLKIDTNEIKLKENNSSIKKQNNIKANNKIKNIQKDIYMYKVKLLIGKYNLTCIGKKNDCSKIQQKKHLINNFYIGSYNGSIENISNFHLNINDYFKNNFNENNFKNNIKSLLYDNQKNLVKYVKIDYSKYKNYFEFKRKSNGEIILNSLEIQCFNDIRSSIVPGTFEEDEIIKQQVLDKCSNLGGDNYIIENNKNSLIINLDIKSIKIDYLFLKKQGDSFIEFDEKNNDFPINKKIKININ